MTRADSSGGVLVVGLGHPDRGDDAVGVEVARAVDRLGLPHVRVVEHEDPVELIDLWSGCGGVVVVDAVRSDGSGGRLCILETGAGLEPLPEDAWTRTGRGGTHAFGLAAAVELARALRRLPPRVTLVGVTGSGFERGAPLSPVVAAAVPGAIQAVLAVLGLGSRPDPGPDRRRRPNPDTHPDMLPTPDLDRMDGGTDRVPR